MCIWDDQLKLSHQADHLAAKFAIKPIYSAASPSRLTPLLQLWHRRISGYSFHRLRRIVFANIDRGIRPEYAPRHQHKVAHTSLVVIIVDNHLHQQTPLRRRHHRPWSTSTPTKSSSSSDAAQF
jgi:hypothetical protein